MVLPWRYSNIGDIVCPFVVFKLTLLETWVVKIGLNSTNVEIFSLEDAWFKLQRFG